MSLTLKSVLHYTDGVINNKSASNLFLFVHPNKLKSPYSLKPSDGVFGKIISVEPNEILGKEDESFNSLYESANDISISMIFHPAYETKDFLYLTKHTSNQLSKVGIIPEEFTIAVEIEYVKSGIFPKKVYPKAQVYDNEA